MPGQTLFQNTHVAAELLPIHVTGASNGFDGTPIKRPEGYEDHQLALCTAGTGIFTCEGKSIRVHPGEYFFFRKRFPHAYGPAEPVWRLKWVSFNGSGSDGMLDYLRYPLHFVRPAANPDTESLLDMLVLALTREDPFQAALHLQELLKACRTDPRTSPGHERLEKVVRFIRSDYPRCLSIEELATVHGSSVSYLCRAFKAAYDTTPIDFLNRYRISVAQSLLLDSGRTIQDIAALTGYSHANYFCTAFRRQTGCSPTRFRERFGLFAAGS